MEKSPNRSSKKCLNPWLNFLAIFCVAALVLLTVFVLEKNHIEINLLKVLSKEDSKDSILISATGIKPTDSIAVQFETCPIFFIVDESAGNYECFSNKASAYSIQEIRSFIRHQNVGTVITGTMDLETYRIFNTAHVEVYTGVIGTVEDALKKYKRHKLVSISRDYYNKRRNASLLNTGKIKSVKKAKF